MVEVKVITRIGIYEAMGATDWLRNALRRRQGDPSQGKGFIYYLVRESCTKRQ